jgi:hypothetical protein
MSDEDWQHKKDEDESLNYAGRPVPPVEATNDSRAKPLRECTVEELRTELALRESWRARAEANAEAKRDEIAAAEAIAGPNRRAHALAQIELHAGSGGWFNVGPGLLARKATEPGMWITRFAAGKHGWMDVVDPYTLDALLDLAERHDQNS